MRNLKLVDLVVALHEIAVEVHTETGNTVLSEDIHLCADRLHELSIQDSKNSITAKDIITKAKQ
ncbi:hypothetical protein UFOVP181_252 [uncultured Caudovirales phage]|uniref:Uncharacterized protein n=1 Tax=uncultured Caudovirales phage TaxID=2100421 RepID=A0A6J5KYB3_9CAUD|nr:hypothetical protein UFOVP57_387 [uncultured Caudovirales phage]CAB5208931.1 hypothetical protein UFOVP181_252 [uncultured Caudovirales phage]